jgi:hypothetical protein
MKTANQYRENAARASWRMRMGLMRSAVGGDE